LAAVLLGLGPAMGRAELELTQPGDPRRRWNASVLTTAGYDDNINTAPTSSSNRRGSATINVEPQIALQIPGEQTSGQLRYTYDATFYTDQNTSEPHESHVVDAAFTHVFTPRLTVSFSDSFRHGIEPELVEQQISGTPITTRQRGEYSYNSVNGGVNFQATSRWSLSLNQSWERWIFALQKESDANDRDGYTTVVSSSYALDPRTFVGGSYRFSLTDYSIASTTNELRDSTSHALYATVVHRFSPLLVAQLNAGIQMAGFTGQTDMSPYVSASGAYNFGRNSTLSAGFTYNIQLTEVAAYRSSDQAASFLSFHYRATRKLGMTASFSYVIATYQNLSPLFLNPNDVTQKSSAGEDSWRLGVSVNYDFTPWAALFMNYGYEEVDSSLDNPITGSVRSYYRSRFGAGLRLRY